LVDCAIVVAAKERGFAEHLGLRLTLSREPSWAAIRDKVAFGALDAAHMLAGMPLAMTLGLGGDVSVPMVAPMALGMGGNAVTVSQSLYREMVEADHAAMSGPRAFRARALAGAVARRRSAGRLPPRLATVFPFSSHNYELRYWLAAAGIDPDRDVELTVIPPPRMVESLRSGFIDGFCVGEPWNQVAVAEELGGVVVTKQDIWPACPEKILGLRRDWMEANLADVVRLVQALIEAARWCDDPANRVELARILSRPAYIGVPESLLLASLGGVPVLAPGVAPESLPDYHIFYRGTATFPWISQAEWLLVQMGRWGQLDFGRIDGAAVADAVYRPDVYAHAAALLGAPVPAAPFKDEGAHTVPFTVAAVGGGVIEMAADAIFDGNAFRPAPRRSVAYPSTLTRATI
jgi:NitT/TauT family transport system ATP-binding protein/nitrate/nitrite transport system substrate-binding protein